MRSHSLEYICHSWAWLLWESPLPSRGAECVLLTCPCSLGDLCKKKEWGTQLTKKKKRMSQHNHIIQCSLALHWSAISSIHFLSARILEPVLKFQCMKDFNTFPWNLVVMCPQNNTLFRSSDVWKSVQCDEARSPNCREVRTAHIAQCSKLQHVSMPFEAPCIH